MAKEHELVVVMTSSGQQQDMADAYGLGINSYLVKPVEFNAFAEKSPVVSTPQRSPAQALMSRMRVAPCEPPV